jgi:hypothetical protein
MCRHQLGHVDGGEPLPPGADLPAEDHANRGARQKLPTATVKNANSSNKQKNCYWKLFEFLIFFLIFDNFISLSFYS